MRRAGTGRVKAEPGRGLLERRIRAAWGSPGPLLRAGATVYGLAADARNALWSAGVFVPRRIGVPVISLGGLTTGGSGKTPLAAALARHLADAGARVALLTPGQPDELALHATLNPDVLVRGGRWRVPLAREAVRLGAEVILLDSGFQHRRLHRDLDLVTCNADHSANRERLPAGPYRERFAALRRADGVIVVRRATSREQTMELIDDVLAVAPGIFIACLRFRPVGLKPANPAAEAIGRPEPSVAVAGVMWPESFFRWLSRHGVEPENRIALPDHAAYDEASVTDLAELAGARGVVCTRKDAVRLVPMAPEGLPVWWLEERPEWESGGTELLAGVRRAAELPA